MGSGVTVNSPFWTDDGICPSLIETFVIVTGDVLPPTPATVNLIRRTSPDPLSAFEVAYVVNTMTPGLLVLAARPNPAAWAIPETATL
jgi:hypothetical protein